MDFEPTERRHGDYLISTDPDRVDIEELSGLLVRPLRRSLETQTLPGFEPMNEALEGRVEACLARA